MLDRMFRFYTFALTAGLVLSGQFLLHHHAQAQGKGVIPIQRIDGPIRLDGLSDEAAWEAVTPFIPTQYEPNNGAAPTEKTEFRVAYDDSYLYLSLRAYDRDPEGIRYNTLYRDGLNADDHFEVMLDTFNDNQSGIVFTTTPAGIRREAALSNDANGGGVTTGGWLNLSFNTYWGVATTRNQDGWFAEIRIPFSSLRFQEGPDGKVTMGITMQRKIARKTERLIFPSIPAVVNWAFLKPSMAQKIQFEGIHPHQPIYVTPYGLTGMGRSASAIAAPAGTVDGYRYVNDHQLEVGGDLKMLLSNKSTLDLTVNTDFAQVEADDQQINLTRFSLFFPEKRQFFQERAALFDFRTGDLSRLFHSRRIGIADNGKPVRLLGGARYVGKFGQWDVGGIDMQTDRSATLPSENFGVFRARRQVFNPYSHAGGMVTSRLGTDGNYNMAYGLDGVFRVRGADYLTLQWAQTFDKGLIDAGREHGLNGGWLTAEMERRRRDAWGYHSVLAWAGPAYDPGIGYVQRNDFTMLDNTLSYTWLPGAESPLIRHTLELEAVGFLRNESGVLESAEIGPEWEATAKTQAGGSAEAKLLYEDLPVPFALSDKVEIPVGRYTFFRVGASYHESYAKKVQFSPEVNAGTFYDGWQVTGEISPEVFISPHLELSGTYQYSHIRFPERDQTFDAHLVRLRIGTALNTKLSTNAFLQYNSAIEVMSANVRFRYNFQEGSDLWIVYSQGVNTWRKRFDPALLLVDNQTLLVKYTHTFAL
ncbi:MAG TPA: DUF5916 domain-containing protein [Rhodothermales bacterium]|nr:DUF5916 domain-containing protein [Rhodothermales bacterium]